MKTGLFSTPPPPPFDEGWEPGVCFYVQDNGQGANADPDVLSLIAVDEPRANAAAWCEETLVPNEDGIIEWDPPVGDPWGMFTFDITAGNIQVDG